MAATCSRRIPLDAPTHPVQCALSAATCLVSMAAMSLTMHVIVFTLLVVDLLVGGWAVGRFGGHRATSAFEFITILGYIIFVLQWGVPWGQGERDDG